jgi:hypothetical protein
MWAVEKPNDRQKVNNHLSQRDVVTCSQDFEVHQDRYTRALVPVTGAQQFRVDHLVQIRRTRPVGGKTEWRKYRFSIIIIVIIITTIIRLAWSRKNKK